MRYLNEELKIWTDGAGVTHTLRNFRLIPTDFIIAQTMPVTKDMKVDDIASSRGVYGEGAESESFKIFEANGLKLIENKFVLNKLKELKIPV